MFTDPVLDRPPPGSVPERRTRQRKVLLAISTGVAMVLLAPLVFLLIEAGSAGASTILHLIFRPLTGTLLWNTIRLTVVVTALCAIIGTLTAWCVERTDLPGRRISIPSSRQGHGSRTPRFFPPGRAGTRRPGRSLRLLDVRGWSTRSHRGEHRQCDVAHRSLQWHGSSACHADGTTGCPPGRSQLGRNRSQPRTQHLSGPGDAGHRYRLCPQLLHGALRRRILLPERSTADSGLRHPVLSLGPGRGKASVAHAPVSLEEVARSLGLGRLAVLQPGILRGGPDESEVRPAGRVSPIRRRRGWSARSPLPEARTSTPAGWWRRRSG